MSFSQEKQKKLYSHKATETQRKKTIALLSASVALCESFLLLSYVLALNLIPLEIYLIKILTNLPKAQIILSHQHQTYRVHALHLHQPSMQLSWIYYKKRA